MKERPILFSGQMVRAILDGRKSQTRRVVKPMSGEQSKWLTPESILRVPHGEMIKGGWQMHHPLAGTRHRGVDVAHDSPLGWIRCPYGTHGDRLWVRETYSFDRLDVDRNGTLPPWYWADGNPGRGDWTKPRPSIHMPRWASRITLEITGVRVERLQYISERDAADEGVGDLVTGAREGNPDQYRATFRDLWSDINGAGSWAANPWVWVVEFRRIDQVSV